MRNNTVDGWPSADIFLGAMGFGLVVASLYAMFFGTAFSYGDVAAGWLQTGWQNGLGLVALVAAQVLMLQFSDACTKLGVHRFRWPASVALALLVGASFTMEKLPEGLLAVLSPVCWIVAGACMAAVLVSWADFLCSLEKRQIVRAFIVVFAAAGVAYAAALLAGHEGSRFVVMLYVLLSSLFYGAAMNGREKPAFVSKGACLENLHLDIRSTVSYALTGLVLGFVVMELAASAVAPFAPFLVGGGMAASAGVAWAVVGLREGSWLLLGPVERVTFPVLVICLLVLPYVGEPVSLVVLFVLLTALFVRDMSRAVNRSILPAEFTVQNCYLFVRTSLPILLGLAGGCLVEVFAFSLIPGQAGVVCSILLVSCLSIAITTAPYGTDPLTMPELPPAAVMSERNDCGVGLWRTACDRVAEANSLTPRESEVFHLLARGRSTHVIAQQLGISIYTVKSHTYNVYRKLGTESQQDLIDAVERERMSIRADRESPHARF